MQEAEYNGPVVPFELNGITTDDIGYPDPNPDPVSPPFKPQNSSTPIGLHSLSESTTTLSLSNSSIQQRSQAGYNLPWRINDTWNESKTNLLSISIMQAAILNPRGWNPSEFWYTKYIDDGLGGEMKLNNLGVSHITDKKETKMLHAKECENFMKLTTDNAKKIGMQINANKTKLLCISVAKSSLINTYVKHQ